MTDTTLLPLSCAQLQQQCVDRNLPTQYRLKADLVERLSQFFQETNTRVAKLVPSAGFFDFAYNKWKQDKQNIDDGHLEDCTTYAQWWQNCARGFKTDLPKISAAKADRKTMEDLKLIVVCKNPGTRFI